MRGKFFFCWGNSGVREGKTRREGPDPTLPTPSWCPAKQKVHTPGRERVPSALSMTARGWGTPRPPAAGPRSSPPCSLSATCRPCPSRSPPPPAATAKSPPPSTSSPARHRRPRSQIWSPRGSWVKVRSSTGSRMEVVPGPARIWHRGFTNDERSDRVFTSDVVLWRKKASVKVMGHVPSQREHHDVGAASTGVSFQLKVSKTFFLPFAHSRDFY